MERKILVAKEEGEQISELPLEEDGSLLFSTLVKFFPQARGLRYYTEIDTIRGVKLSNGRFHPPYAKWGSTVFYCVSLDEFNTNPTTSEKTPVSSEETNGSVYDVGNESEEVQVKVEIKEETEIPLVPQNNVMLLDFGGVKSEDISPDDSSRRMKFKTMSNKRPHKCDICGNCFTQQSHMQRHRRIHTGEKPFSCEACGEKFSRSDKLKLHTYKCNAILKLIDESYECPKSLEKRQKREIKPKVLDESYEWGTLPPGTKNKSPATSFRKNIQIDHDTANGEYYSVVNMAEVRMEEGNDDQKYFDCTTCSKVFTKKNQLQRHIRTHSGERPFTCKLCDKSFTRIDALKRHMASVGHRKQKELHPDVDDGLNMEYESLDIKNDIDFARNDILFRDTSEVFDQMESQHDGMDRTMDDDEEEETTCDVARFAQVTYSNLESGKSEPEDPPTELNDDVNEAKSKENYCHICQHTFTNKFNYTRHMKSHDKVSKSYKCTYCQYMFRRQSHLTRHTLIHTGEKPFQCTHCGERFSRSDKMKLHIARIHSHDANDNEAVEIIKVREVTPIVIFKTEPESTLDGGDPIN